MHIRMHVRQGSTACRPLGQLGPVGAAIGSTHNIDTAHISNGIITGVDGQRQGIPGLPVGKIRPACNPLVAPAYVVIDIDPSGSPIIRAPDTTDTISRPL